MSRQLRTEQDHHLKFFEYYYSLGESRSYEKVAAAMGVSVAAIKLIAASFNWKQRVHERDLDRARQLADRTLQTTMEDQARYQKVVRMAVMKLAKAIAEDKIKLQGADLDRLIRLDAFLAPTVASGALPATANAAQIVAFLDGLTTHVLNEMMALMARRAEEKTAISQPTAAETPISEPAEKVDRSRP